MFRTLLTSANPCYTNNKWTTVYFDTNQANQLLSRVLFHLASSSVKCLISSRQVLPALFKSNKAVQIQKKVSLICNYMTDKEISYAFIQKNGAKI